MKNLTLFIFILFSFLLTARAQQELTDSQKQQIQSENILLNGGFEAGKTSWTSGAGTVTSSTTAIKGKRSISVSLSSQTLNVYQDSTLYASQYAGSVQGLAYARVKTTLSTVKVCARQAGVTSSTLCVSHSGSGNWELLKVPFILSSTSNGIAINTSSSATGTVLIDDTFVGAVDLKVDTNNISNWTTGTCTGTWSNTTYDCKYMRYGDAMKLQVKATVTGAVSGNLSIGVPSGFTIDTSKLVNTSIQMPMGTGSFWDTSASQDYAIYPLYQNSSLLFIAYSTSVNTGVAALSSSAPVAIGVGDVVSIMVDIPIVGWASSGSIYSSTNADTDWQTCGHTTSSFTGFGTVSSIETQCKRQGGDLLMKGKFTAGTPTATEARVSLPAWNGTSLVAKGTSVIPSVQIAGTAGIVYSSTTYFGQTVLIEPSVSYVTFGLQSNTTNALTKAVGTAVAVTSQPFSFDARIPIEGWENSNIIIGQFNGLESCTDTYQCTDVYSAKIDASGVVTSENIEWITGNASIASTSQYTLTFKTGLFTQAPNCTVSLIDGASSGILRVFAISSSSVSVFTESTTPAAAARAFGIICQKQGADYIGRTARAVASDQNVRSVGSVGVDIQSVYFGATSSNGCVTSCTTGTCGICNQVGSKITSVTWVTGGNYRLNGIDGTKYNCHGTGYNGSVTQLFLGNRAASSSTYAQIESPNAVGYASVTCIGIP